MKKIRKLVLKMDDGESELKMLNNEKLELNLELYKNLYLIRKAEDLIIRGYPQDEMKTPMHMSRGEEAITVGVCHALGEKDQVFGTYRSHALYISSTLETDKFFAEMYGKETGLAKGKAGSMHLSYPERGNMGSSAIVGSIIPVAVGAAFANKMKKNNKIVAVFFGDGAIDEGTFWESLNVASLMNLPILFVCEDNGFAVHTSGKNRHGYDSITKIVSNFNCNVIEDDTTDVEEIYNLAGESIDLIKTTQQPCFLYLKYYRYLEHVGIYEDFDAGYRSKEEFLNWLKKDPVNLQRKKLIDNGLNENEIKKVENEIDDKVEKSVLLAKEADFACKDELYRGVFHGK